ncbi:uncharacterized protein LOC125556643 isoform X1 [Triticum urartu]|uniref:uncharacterized protein LOC125556643 isoform X1 n=1 Tax=Triticum urartu TaxID=4572 RepID=UPI00204425D6|nr:uncharacterized protein LOC125556643 isoform X1 [Triticum urartu]
MLDNPGRPVWLTGHSAGASLALHVGTHMVLKKEIKLPTFAFNPPVAILGWLPIPKRVKKLIGPLIPSKRKQSLKLCSWTPVLYVHQRDFFFCRRIIGCLEQPTKLDKWVINLPSLTMCANSAIVQAGGEQCGQHSIKQWFSPNSEINMTCQNTQEDGKHIPEALSRFSLGYAIASNGLHAKYQGYEFPLLSSDVPQAL